MIEILTVQEMIEADRLAVAQGTSGRILMERAGAAVALAVLRRYRRARRIVVLAGPGNNGGDGYVAARHLVRFGVHVAVAALVPSGAFAGDAGAAAADWTGRTIPLAGAPLDRADLVIDALFGAGLARPLAGAALAAVERLQEGGPPVVAIDVPSGIDGTTGAILGRAPRACMTVTFFRRKPGHLLLPGRSKVGELVVADIGIADEVLGEIRPKTFANEPPLWQGALPRPDARSHKYSRGYVLVASGPPHRTGAARLAARAALRAGAGLVTVAGRPEVLPALAAQLTAVTISPIEDAPALVALFSDERFGAAVLGPALGIGEETRKAVLGLLGSRRPLVLDADALTSFAEDPDLLFRAIRADSGAAVVLTPHEGEFRRLFPDLTGPSKLDRARAAASRSGATVLLKGADTVVAAPSGRAAVSGNGTPHLATGGSGDVLAGVIAALLAQHMPPFEAACAAAWLHAEAGEIGGCGLIAEDLPELLPLALKPFHSGRVPPP